MTKSDRIRALYDGTRTTREIADIVGCLPSYVRVVCRQRVNGRSPSDKTYMDRLRSEGSVPAARKAWRTVYRQARKAGLPIREAERQGASVYMRTLRQTARAKVSAKL